jgi:hypothetical protein
MKTDFIPKRNGDLDSMEENFEDKYPAIATTLGIAAAEQTNTLNIIGTHRTSYTTMISKIAEKKAAVEDNTAKKKTAITEIRRASKNLKSRPGYTEAQGDELGINGPEAPDIDTVNIKPILKGSTVGETAVVGFPLEGTDGLQLRSRRGSETEFTFLATDTHSPYDDTRPKLDSAQPEKREYIGYYILDDEIIGQPSDVLTITVG